MARIARKPIAIIVAALLATFTGYEIWLCLKYPEYPITHPFVWLSNFSMQVNDMTLQVKLLSSDGTETEVGQFLTTITDLRNGKRWQNTTRGQRPIFLSHDRNRVLVAELAHTGGHVHLWWWYFRKNVETSGEVVACMPLSEFTSATDLAYSADDRFVAMTLPACRGLNSLEVGEVPHPNEYIVEVNGLSMEFGYEGGVLEKRRNLHSHFDGDRLIIDDHLHHYILHLTIVGDPNGKWNYVQWK